MGDFMNDLPCAAYVLLMALVALMRSIRMSLCQWRPCSWPSQSDPLGNTDEEERNVS